LSHKRLFSFLLNVIFFSHCSQIADNLKKSKKVVAVYQLGPEGTTLHHWVYLKDGRFTNEELVDRIRNEDAWVGTEDS
jgi:hypothetical protein